MRASEYARAYGRSSAPVRPIFDAQYGSGENTARRKTKMYNNNKTPVRGEGGEGAPVKIKYAYLYEYIVYTRGDALNVRTARV